MNTKRKEFPRASLSYFPFRGYSSRHLASPDGANVKRSPQGVRFARGPRSETLRRPPLGTAQYGYPAPGLARHLAAEIHPCRVVLPCRPQKALGREARAHPVDGVDVGPPNDFWIGVRQTFSLMLLAAAGSACAHRTQGAPRMLG